MVMAWKDLGWPYAKNAPGVGEPIQGIAPTCAFIAALASLAWMGKVSQNISLVSGMYKLIFYSQPNTSSYSIVEVTPSLPVDADSLVYSESREYGETWPAIWEKGYARYRLQRAGEPSNPYTVREDSTKFYKDIPWGKNSREALMHLKGKPYVTFLNAGKNGDAVYGEISSKCSNQKTLFPAVAWTYVAGSQYDNYNLVADHSYSVLGVISSEKKIVLRNPFGIGNGPLDSASTSWNNITINNNQGIWGISAGDFQKNFEGWGYLQLV